ncbi:MAG: helix-turn-helix transcriptional regulator [Bacteroidales bacterium]|jgi:DNA-binding XRE family transcriptional regulator|nr:helix-turn-helix transcriptional regulator [Bacteroidales bacterium]
MTEIRKLNRIKVVLAEKDLTNKWLGQQLGKSEYTVSRWTTNKQQPSVEQLFDIAKLLNVEVKDLLLTQDKVD